jgi:hypothetical protein
MTIEARITPIWKKQKLFVALFLMAFGGWFFWDGFVGYPAKNVRYAAWRGYIVEGKEAEWAEFAKAKGWKGDEWPPFVKEHHFDPKQRAFAMTGEQIMGQKVYGSILVVIGLIVLVYWAQQIRRVLKLDEEGVTSPAGTRVPFEAITGLGLKKWESKGYAKVRYAIGGRKGEFLIDDYKFDTEPTRAIVDEIKRRLERRAA